MQELQLFSDMQDYHDRAVHLLRTGRLFPDALRVPGYPVFLALLFRLAGPGFLAVQVLQALLGTATVALTYLLARPVVGPRRAPAAALAVAVYPALLLYPAYLMSETLFSFLALLALAGWLASGVGSAAVAGLALGAATLTRSVGWAVLGGILLAEGWRLVVRRERANRVALARLALLLVGFGLVLAPWVARNHALYGRVVLGETSWGFNVLLGHYPGATGRHPGLPAAEAAARNYLTGARDDLDRSDRGLREAWAFVRAQPGRTLTLAVRKVGYLLGVEGREHAWGYSYHVQGRRAPATVWAWGLAIIVSFPLLLSAAVVGGWRPGEPPLPATDLIGTTALAVAGLHVLSFGESRFHLPWVPLVAVVAARALPGRRPLTWSWPRRVGLAVSLLGLVALWAGQVPELLAVLPTLAASPEPLRLPY